MYKEDKSMTLGEKITKYRKLKNLTQKELGLAVGFKTTPNVRINQYENDKMAPKADLRVKIAKELDIDVNLLTELDIQTPTDAIHALFNIEDCFDIALEVHDNSIHVVFDTNSNSNKELASYLTIWANQKNNIVASTTDNNNANINYEIWKSRFPMSIHEFWETKKKEFITYYTQLAKNTPITSDIKNKSEFYNMIREMVSKGITVHSTTTLISFGEMSLTLIFDFDEIMNSINNFETIQYEFLRFLYVIESLRGYNINCDFKVLSNKQALELLCTINHSSLATFSGLVDEINRYEGSKNQLDPFSKQEALKTLSEAINKYDFEFGGN